MSAETSQTETELLREEVKRLTKALEDIWWVDKRCDDETEASSALSEVGMIAHRTLYK